MNMLSQDGYVRLTLSTLQNTPFVHLVSGLDEDDHGLDPPRADGCAISGYTEWISSTTPAITIGWDWRLDASPAGPRFVSVGLPRSNVMLLDADHHDLGPTSTDMLLKVVVDAIGWKVVTANIVSERYAATT